MKDDHWISQLYHSIIKETFVGVQFGMQAFEGQEYCVELVEYETT